MDQRENRFYREPQPSGQQAEQPAEEARGADFEAWWDAEIARNGGVGFGADYRHWARKGWDAALLAAPAAGTGQHPVIRMLIEVARCAFLALDHSEEREGPDGREHVLDAQSFDDLSDALDALDGLPDDQPGVTMGPAQKAEWALRTVAATGAQGLIALLREARDAVEQRWEESNTVADHDLLQRIDAALAASKEWA